MRDLAYLSRETQLSAHHGHMRMIPARYHKVSGIGAFYPRICSAGGPYHLFLKIDRRARDYAACRAIIRKSIMTVLVPDTEDDLYSSLVMFNDPKGWQRSVRFVNYYKIYECLENNRRIEFSAIRHAIAHPARRLHNKEVVNFLKEKFGSTKLDLESYPPNYRHLRIFYSYFGKLIMETDEVILQAVMARKPRDTQYAGKYYLI